MAADLVEEYAKHSGVSMDELRRAAGMFQSIRVQATRPV